MFLSHGRTLVAFGAILVVLVQCGCETVGTSATRTATTSTPSSERPLATETLNALSIVPTNRPQPYGTETPISVIPTFTSVSTDTPQSHDIDTPMAASPSPTFATGFTGCIPDMRAGGAARTNNNCWQGIVNGYYVFITAGKENNRPEKDSCGIEGFFEIEASLPGADPYDSIRDREYAGCAALHIRDVSGSLATFDGGASFTVDLTSFLPTPTPQPRFATTRTPIP